MERVWIDFVSMFTGTLPEGSLATQAMRGPTAVTVPEEVGGLRKASIALCHQLTTLDRRKLTERMGTLSRDLLNQVEEGLKAALDLE